MNAAWLTDIHLNFIDKKARINFYQKIIDTQCDIILISGDIAEAPCLTDILNEMADFIPKPMYFILGNHDYYRAQIEEVRNALKVLAKTNNQLFWLSASGIQQLDNDTILLGQDGWADGRLGDYQNSCVILNDSRMIADLFQEKVLGKFQLLEKMQQLADADALQLKNNLAEAILKNPKNIIVLTHVPPFKESCLHQGVISDDYWLPYFSSKIIGDVLMEVARNNSTVNFLVLCGHTHSKAKYQPIDNIIVEVGKAEYYQPEIQKIIRV